MKGRLWRKALAAALALLIVSGSVPIQPFSRVLDDIAITASADATTQTVEYMDYNEETQKMEKRTHEATVINKNNMPTSLSGWYVVTENVNYSFSDASAKIKLDDDVHLILSDGVSMTVEGTGSWGFRTSDSSKSFYIYGQENGTGKLSVSCRGDGIYCGNLYMYGGNVEVNANHPIATGQGKECVIRGGSARLVGSGGILNAKIILGWTNNGDNYFATKWKGNDDVSVTLENSFWLQGTKTAATDSNIDGQTIVPAGTYGVTIAETEHGIVIADKDAGNAGETVTLTVTPDTNYKLGAIGAKDADNSTVTLTDNGNGTYSFVIPEKDITVTASFVVDDKTNLNSAVISGVHDVYRWTDSVIDITPAVKQDDETIEPSNYNISYKCDGETISEIKSPGIYTMTVTGKGSYTGSASVTFRVLAFQKYENNALVTISVPNDNFSIVTDETNSMSAGWYVVNEDVIISDHISVSGDVHLVLCNGATLTASKGITVTDGNSLTIYGQEGNTGKLIASQANDSGYAYAGIGGYKKLSSNPVKAGAITIHGGDITATGNYNCAGIGKGNGGEAGDITIYGGKITATADGNEGTGIGSTNATVHLGWANSSDYINASGFEGDVTFDKVFVLESDENTVATKDNSAGVKIIPNTASTCTVTFDSKGGTSVQSQNIREGRTATEPGRPMKQNYSFDGWYTDSACTNSFDFSTEISQDTILYAKWVAVSAISYVGVDGQTVSGYTDYTPLGDNCTALSAGTYFVDKNITLSQRINLNGEVSIILGDGYTLTAEKGIAVKEGNTLNLFCQSAGTGALIATAATGNAAIGSDNHDNVSGTVKIYGGNITATGGTNAAGIGGGDGYNININDAGGNNGAVYIYGGTVSATGQNIAAAIGGGSYGAGGTISIYGGNVTAYGGGSAAAIGGGCYNEGGTIKLLGGKVETKEIAGDTGGVGIGGGKNDTTSGLLSADITLGYSKSEDFIKAVRYSGNVTIENGKKFVTDDTTPAEISGSVDDDTVINGKKLMPKKYTVSFDLGGAAGTAPASQTICHGFTVIAPNSSPFRTGYTFDGWKNGNAVFDLTSAVTDNLTLTAAWTAHTYKVKFNGNGATSGSMSEQGFTYDEAKKALTANAFTRTGYTFKGWNTKADGSGTPYADKAEVQNLTTVNNDTITLYAQWKVNKYTVTWKNGDTTLETDTNVPYGTTPSYNGATPTKAATAQYSYTFSGWSNGTNTYGVNAALPSVSNNVTYTAQFSSTVNEYTVTWVDGDGNTLKTEQVAYGETPAYTGDTPTKAATAQYSYTFKGWGTITAVTANVTYTAQFDSEVNKYTVTWLDGDGKTLKTEQVAYGETPAYTGDTPTKAATAQYSYTFKGWGTITAVTGNATYTAQFDSEVNKYTITWKNGDTVLETDTDVEYGTEPHYDGATPTKASTSSYTYTFAGWSPAFSAVTGNVTYTATFTAHSIYVPPTYDDQSWTLTMDDYVYDGTAHTPTINGTAYTYSYTKVEYTYYNTDTGEELDGAPSAVGNYKVKVYADGGSN